MENERVEATTVVKKLGKNVGKEAAEISSTGFLYFLLFIGWICLAAFVAATTGSVLIAGGAIVGAFMQTTSASSFIMVGAGLLLASLIYPIIFATKAYITKFMELRITVKNIGK